MGVNRGHFPPIEEPRHFKVPAAALWGSHHTAELQGVPFSEGVFSSSDVHGEISACGQSKTRRVVGGPAHASLLPGTTSGLAEGNRREFSVEMFYFTRSGWKTWTLSRGLPALGTKQQLQVEEVPEPSASVSHLLKMFCLMEQLSCKPERGTKGFYHSGGLNSAACGRKWCVKGWHSSGLSESTVAVLAH